MSKSDMIHTLYIQPLLIIGAITFFALTFEVIAWGVEIWDDE